MYASSARGPERCKVVVRNLPPALTQEDFMQALSQASEQYDWTSFVPGKVRWVPLACRCRLVIDTPPLLCHSHAAVDVTLGRSTKRTRPSCCYVHFKTHSDVLAFKTAFAKRTFADGSKQQPCVVEYAPFQRVPPSRTKRDPRENTIDTGVPPCAFPTASLLLDTSCSQAFLRCRRGLCGVPCRPREGQGGAAQRRGPARATGSGSRR